MDAYDYLIVGGGSAGCVLANRLSANPSHRVLLLEAGKSADTPLVALSFGFAMMLGNPRYDWQYQTGPEPGLGGKIAPYPRGKVIGGSSSINAMLYVRGFKRDYDAWAADPGMSDWSWAQVEPYLRKMEDYCAVSPNRRGSGGPTKVTPAPNFHPVARLMVAAAGQSSVGSTEDYNGEEPSGIGRAQLFYRNGRRSGSNAAYLRPARGRKNLTVVTGATVERVRIEGRRAVGVEYRINGEARFASARETILSAGAIGSPQLLELSGLGQADRLTSLGISPIHDLPAVGEHLQDHYLVFVVQQLHGIRGLGAELTGWRSLVNGAAYMLFNRGYLNGTPTQVNGHGNVDVDGEAVALQFMGMPLSFSYDDNKKSIVLSAAPSLMLGCNVCHPQSRGSVHAISAAIADKPTIVNNFLAVERDVSATIAGLRCIREVLNQPALAPYLGDETSPGGAATSDEALEQYVRASGASAYHPVGTCRMGSDPATSVVDPQLRVHGIEGLRVVDASVMPRLPSANTHAPTLMIAERAADLILGG